MFVQFTTPEGPPMFVRASRVLAFTGAADGTTHIILGATLSVVVSEAPDVVELLLATELNGRD